MAGDESIYAATLSPRARLVGHGVGLGVGLGVPLALGIGFAVGFAEPRFLAFPLPFAILVALAWLTRVTGYRLTGDRIEILSPTMVTRVDLSRLAAVRFPASPPPGIVIGMWRMDGFWGTRGTFWNRKWGRFRVYVTDERKRVELLLGSGRRVIVSPDQPEDFLRAVSARPARDRKPENPYQEGAGGV